MDIAPTWKSTIGRRIKVLTSPDFGAAAKVAAEQQLMKVADYLDKKSHHNEREEAVA